jgi:periplasmic protein TonB
MFETVAPEITNRRSRLILYESLPVSLAVHGVAIAVAVVFAVWNVTFPAQSPRFVRAYQLITIPDPPPPPPPPAPPKLTVPRTNIVPAKLPENVAPTIIPDEIPVVTNELPKPEMTSTVGAVNGVEGGIEGGVVGGTPTGIFGGDLGGQTGGVIGGIPKDAPIIIERDKPLPMYPVSQVYPRYPEDARLRHWEDSLVVKYTIGKDGRVKEVIVLTPPGRPVFAEVAVKAIRNWRFRPMIRDGEAKEVVHELTVFFKLEPGA